jgi:hypothetical protein
VPRKAYRCLCRITGSMKPFFSDQEGWVSKQMRRDEILRWIGEENGALGRSQAADIHRRHRRERNGTLPPSGHGVRRGAIGVRAQAENIAAVRSLRHRPGSRAVTTMAGESVRSRGVRELSAGYERRSRRLGAARLTDGRARRCPGEQRDQENLRSRRTDGSHRCPGRGVQQSTHGCQG